MDKIDLGRIPSESVSKVRAALKAASPKMMSLYQIRMATTIQDTSSLKILRYLELLGQVEKLQSTGSETFWRWRLDGN